MKTVFHGAIAEPCRRAPVSMAYAIGPPKIWAQPSKENQMRQRSPCSRRVHHWEAGRCQSSCQVVRMPAWLVCFEGRGWDGGQESRRERRMSY